jgi:hypothetical protein
MAALHFSMICASIPDRLNAVELVPQSLIRALIESQDRYSPKKS